MNRAPSFMMYPAKFVAGTRHLSDEACRAFTEIMMWMWQHSSNYYSMEDTDAAWSLATNIKDPDKLERVRDEIMNPLFPLLKKTKQKRVCNGLKKERKNQVMRRKKGKKGGLESGKSRRRKALSAEPKPNPESTQGQPETNTTITTSISNDIDKNKHLVGVFDELWKQYPSNDGKKAALNHFNASVKTEQDVADIRAALKNYLSSDKVQRGFIKNGSTWFNNWRDWIVVADYERPKPKTVGPTYCYVCGYKIGDAGHVDGAHQPGCYGGERKYNCKTGEAI